jgi:hypothetical protein
MTTPTTPDLQAELREKLRSMSLLPQGIVTEANGKRVLHLNEDSLVDLITEAQVAVLEEAGEKRVFVTYREDNGNGLAVPGAVIDDMIESIKKGGE